MWDNSTKYILTITSGGDNDGQKAGGRIRRNFLAGSRGMRQRGYFGGVAVAVALVFGLGGRELAGRELEKWRRSLESDES
jgi:hypothetical protein